MLQSLNFLLGPRPCTACCRTHSAARSRFSGRTQGVCTQRQLVAARDAALTEQLQMLSVSVGEARPLGKGKRYESFDDGCCDVDDDEIVYRSCGSVEEEDLPPADGLVPPPMLMTAFNEAGAKGDSQDALSRQVELLSQILERLQSAGNEITPAMIEQLQTLSAEMAQLTAAHS